MAKECLYCGLQFSDTAQFCPNCGRLIESGFSIRLLQESEVDCLRREVKEKDELIRQLILTQTIRGEAVPPPAQLVAAVSAAAMGGERAQRCCPLGGVEDSGLLWIDSPNRSENQKMQALHQHDTASFLVVTEAAAGLDTKRPP